MTVVGVDLVSSSKCCSRKMLLAISCGQLLSLLVSACGISSGLLASKHSVNIPTSQSFLSYFALSFFLVFALRKTQDSIKDVFKLSLFSYLPLALIDVEANFLVVLAFQYTDLSSVMLLDCWAIPCVMMISHFWLGHRFVRLHFIGAGLCVLGIVIIVIVDWAQHGIASATKNAPLGDLFVLLGASLYAVSNVGQEAMVSSRPRSEYIGFLGFYGTFFSGVQMLLVDWHELNTMEWTGSVLLLLTIFFMGQFLQYSLTPTLMRIAGATFFNLSLLTSDTFAFVISVILFGRKPTVTYIFSALCIVAGIVVYQWAPEPFVPRNINNENDIGHNNSSEDDDDDEEAAKQTSRAALIASSGSAHSNNSDTSPLLKN